ncbi:hypothetical protein E4U42_006327 [Claviceps africana]|uniref:Uncharacterized protein n=1 Tax=Claviceps africana TaxID=83212 RepID=A0A8K0NGS5_9HYPO|nr:hypothetical protein E4U42_006327 [Claviceps africana]
MGSDCSICNIRQQRQPDYSVAVTVLGCDEASSIGKVGKKEQTEASHKQADAGAITPSQLRDVQRAAIAAIVDKQCAHGVRALSSGEFDRRYYFSGFFEKLAGFHQVTPVPRELARMSAPPVAAFNKAGQPCMTAVVCHGKIRYETSPYPEN